MKETCWLCSAVMATALTLTGHLICAIAFARESLFSAHIGALISWMG